MQDFLSPPVAGEPKSPVSIFRVIGWLLVLAGPAICVWVMYDKIWAPEYFSGIKMSVGGVLIFLIILFSRLMWKWAMGVNAEKKAGRWLTGIFVSLYYLLFMGVLINGRMPYQPSERIDKITLPSGTYTFYTRNYTGGLFFNCYEVWVRKGDSPYVDATAGGFCRCDGSGDPVVSGDTVRFYFNDRRFFHNDDQCLEYIGSSGVSYWISARYIPDPRPR
jgi:hypothetical protein